jgi:hypothetical protein
MSKKPNARTVAAIMRSTGSLGGAPGKPVEAISTLGRIGGSRTPGNRNKEREPPELWGAMPGKVKVAPGTDLTKGTGGVWEADR